ncbi:ankyrin repeat domain-containing protein [Agarivorans sp. JK6]|uniref:ankyrin repeat domain-containing protein n=1 Tax=Agarivorans sp. JK6 TaxID=2997426 RepID=UPI0038730E14
MTGKSTAAKIVDAIRNENVKQIRLLFEAEPNQIHYNTPFGGQTWLGYAAFIGKLESLKELEKLGIGINRDDNREGIKPIARAASDGHEKVVQYLLSRGADLDTHLSVCNPLFSAILGKSLPCIQLLLDAGVDSEVRYNSDTMQNMDALAFALMRGCTDGAELIARHIAKKRDLHIDELMSAAKKTAEK